MSSPITLQEQALRNEFNIHPSDVKGRSNKGVEYYKHLLYNKIYSVYDFTLPEDWKLNYFRYWLFHYGSIAGIYTEEYGWICQPYGIKELDLYYNPKVINVASSFLDKPATGIIGLNSEIIHIFDNFYGLDDLVTRYATDLAQLDKSIEINLMNCNTSLVFEAENKKEADTIREAYKQATSGEPLVILNKDIDASKLKELIPVQSIYIVDRLINDRRGIMNAFLTEIGINNANLQKRERLNSDEVNCNNEEVKAIVTVIFENLKKSFIKLNSISGLGLDVQMRYEEQEVSTWEE